MCVCALVVRQWEFDYDTKCKRETWLSRKEYKKQTLIREHKEGHGGDEQRDEKGLRARAEREPQIRGKEGREGHCSAAVP
jgi:hypothetical protein